MNKTFVIAGSYNQFECWCQKCQVSPRSPLVQYVKNKGVLQGTINPSVIYYGTFTHRRDYPEIKNIVNERTIHSKIQRTNKENTKRLCPICESDNVWRQVGYCKFLCFNCQNVWLA